MAYGCSASTSFRAPRAWLSPIQAKTCSACPTRAMPSWTKLRRPEAQSERELDYLSQLYDLYTAVLETIGKWKDYLWVEVPAQMESMKKEADQFAYKCKKMPPQLREWPAYHELKREIEGFQQVLPLLMELSKKSIQQRHWQQVNDITGKDLQVEREDFKLQSLIDAKLNDFKDEILDITESADKQQIIEEKLTDITAQWNTTTFEFSTWKTPGPLGLG
ncbi:unnamed protein product [Effrenium voratum]|nr:unnamed protein product [Effrenium voratum]